MKGQLALAGVVAIFGAALLWLRPHHPPATSGDRLLVDADFETADQRRGAVEAADDTVGLVAFGGMVVMTGCARGRATAPAPPRLSAVIAQLNALPLATTAAAAARRRRPVALAARTARGVLRGARRCVRTPTWRSWHEPRATGGAKIGRAGFGLLLPSVFTALVSLGGDRRRCLSRGARRHPGRGAVGHTVERGQQKAARGAGGVPAPRCARS